MNKVIILSMLPLWSMEKGKGAPSFFNTVNGYASNGWDTYLINPFSKDDDSGIDKLTHITIKLPFRMMLKIPKVAVLFKKFNHLSATRQFIRNAESILLEKGSKDTLIYAYEVYAVLAAKKLSRKHGLPFVTRFQGTPLFFFEDKLITRIKQWDYYKALRTRSNQIIMTDDGTMGADIVRRLGNNSPMVFWRNGVAFNHSETLSNDIDKYLQPDDIPIITVSRLADWKRVDRAINAMPEILASYPKAKLLIAGDGPMRDALEAQAQRMGVSGRVAFLGSLPHDTVYELMNKARVFLSLYNFSNVGNPLLEAMYCAKPIITMEGGGTASLIKDGENGILLRQTEDAKVAPSVVRLLRDTALASALGAAAHQYAVENLITWEQRIKNELTLAESLLSRKERIMSKADLRAFVKADMQMSGLIESGWLNRRLDGREKFYKALRRAEYYTNRYGLASPFARLHRLRYNQLCRKNTWQIPINVCGRGLAIVHYGTIIISGECKIGNNLRIHPGVVLGAAYVKDKQGAPRLGDNVYIGPGAKLFGPITIGDNIAVGANAVVNSSFSEGNVSIAGVPARVVSERGSKRYIEPFMRTEIGNEKA